MTKGFRAIPAAPFLLVLAFVAMVDHSRNVHAVEYLDLTPEQRAHCETAAEQRIRQRCLGAYSVKGLTFPAQAQELGFFSNAAQMAIFKPKGDGPFPAILLLHSCAAVDADPQQMRFWANRALENGYVVFVVDSWGQRGISQICRSSPPGFGPIHMGVRTRDAYEALWHLSKFDFVDSSRVATVGFSNGGQVSYRLGSRSVAEMFSIRNQRFTATVAVYAQCFKREFGNTLLLPDVDRPLLSLLGALDEDGDPKECVPRLQDLKDKGVSVEWHVFPETGHAWDSPNFRVPKRVVQVGVTGSTLFAYDPKVAEESRNRVFEFLARQLKPK